MRVSLIADSIGADAIDLDEPNKALSPPNLLVSRNIIKTKVRSLLAHSIYA